MTIKNVAIVLAIVFATTNAVPYSKFGRSCKDIGCRSDEVCVMAEEPCSYSSQRDQCGRYPTCKRTNTGGESCTTKQCPSGTYCRTENGQPTCVNTNSGLDLGDDMNKRTEGMSQEPQSNDPKPSAPLPDNNAPRPAASNPSYPSSSNSGYPSYPSSSSNSGYPSYPTSQQNANPNLDRYGYPIQSQPVGSYPNYPSSGNSGYPSSNNGYPSYPTQDPTRRQNAAVNNAGYPAQSGYPAQGASGYPAPNPYNNNPYNNNGYRPPQQQGPYQNGYYPQQQGGNPNQAYNPYPTTTKKPSFTDKIANYAKNIAKQVLRQAIVDKVSQSI